MPEKIYVYQIRELRKQFSFVGRWVAVALKEVSPLVRRQLGLYLEKRDIKYAGLLVNGERWMVVIMPKDSRERRRIKSVLHYYGLVGYEEKDLLFVDKEIEGMKPYKVFRRERDNVYVEVVE